MADTLRRLFAKGKVHKHIERIITVGERIAILINEETGLEHRIEDYQHGRLLTLGYADTRKLKRR